jgi:putative spermidine/putrescine transport system ATP-binding protein
VATPRIRFEKVSKSFGALQVVKDLSLDIERGEFVAFSGLLAPARQPC